jgi:hypothetical protein
LQWLANNEASQLLKVVRNLKVITEWRAGLTDFQRLRWSSPQSVLNRCIALRPDGRPRGPVVKAKVMTVSELLKMPSTDGALLLYRRCPAKVARACIA